MVQEHGPDSPGWRESPLRAVLDDLGAPHGHGGRTPTRRRFSRGVAMLAAGGLVVPGGLALASGPALAVEHLEWAVDGAALSSHDGSVSEVVFGDPEGTSGNEIVVSWQGLNDSPTGIDFEVRVKGTDQGAGGWSGGDDETGWEELASAGSELTDPNGEESYGWDQLFDDDTPVDVAAHSEIELADFEAPDAGTTTEQVLAVQLHATVPDEDDLAASAAATGTIAVTNPTLTVMIGFEKGQFDDGEQADEFRFMTDGDEDPQPVDIDVSAFNSVVATLNGAGGADSSADGGAGGRIEVDGDLSGIDTLRTWAGEQPDEAEDDDPSDGGFGRFQGGAGIEGSGGGGGSTHVSDLASLDMGSENGLSDSIAIADAGGGGGNSGFLGLESNDPGGGGARGGEGGDDGDGNDAEGEGEGGDGGDGGGLASDPDPGEDGGQIAGDVTDVTVIDGSDGAGGSGHADITLELSVAKWE